MGVKIASTSVAIHIYRALTDYIQSKLPELARSPTAYKEFVSAPLEDIDNRFVAMADVASCYQYIDHGVLETELLARTAEIQVVEGITTFLEGVSGKLFGLPQGLSGSHVLADVVLDIVQRRMIRSGFALWRYSDDFRIATKTRNEAYAAIEALEEQLRLVGLTLNEEKTSVRSRTEYDFWLNAAQRQREAIQSEVEIDLTMFSHYGEIMEEPDFESVHVASAVQLIRKWESDVNERESLAGPEVVISREILRVALSILGALGDLAGIEYAKKIVEDEPSMTPNLVRYMEKLLGSSGNVVSDCLDNLISADDLFVSAWQHLWLMQLLKRLPNLSAVQTRHLQSMRRVSTQVVAAEASLVLAIHRLISVGDLVVQFNETSEASKLQLVEAIVSVAGSVSSQAVSAVVRERPIFGMVADEVLAR